MAKYYVRSGGVRLILDAPTTEAAATKALAWSRAWQAEVFAEPAGDLLRDAEALAWQLDEEICVSERGFGDAGAVVFQTLDLVLHRSASASLRDLSLATACRRISTSRMSSISQGEDCHAT